MRDDARRSAWIRRLHFWLGLIGIIVFLATGLYMHFVYAHLHDMPDAPRMLFRSAHIYFLLASIINLIVGLYFELAPGPVWSRVQMLTSALLIVSPVLLLFGFFIEPFLSGLRRPYTSLGLYGLFAAGVLEALSGFRKRPTT
jgi:hypothetical protein